uniref:Uncharacterized protein n=1 Tax=Leersia perrieri TaxID=77586 RepID=A0A1Y8Y406_9ORYZ
MIGIEPW